MFNGQPAMVNVSDERRMKSPPALARLFELTALTVPPWGHIMLLEGVSRCGMVTSLDPPSVVAPSLRRSLEDVSDTEERAIVDGNGRRVGGPLDGQVAQDGLIAAKRGCGTGRPLHAPALVRALARPRALRVGLHFGGRCLNHVLSLNIPLAF